MTKKTTTAQKHGQNRLKAKAKARRLDGLKLKKQGSAQGASRSAARNQGEQLKSE